MEFWIVDWSQGIAEMPFPGLRCYFVKLEDVMGGGISFLALVAVWSLPRAARLTEAAVMQSGSGTDFCARELCLTQNRSTQIVSTDLA